MWVCVCVCVCVCVVCWCGRVVVSVGVRVCWCGAAAALCAFCLFQIVLAYCLRLFISPSIPSTFFVYDALILMHTFSSFTIQLFTSFIIYLLLTF